MSAARQVRVGAASRAGIAWGRVPDWVWALAGACDRSSQAEAGRAIGYSASVVNQVLGRCYRGDLARVERAVRLAWLPRQVRCPVLGRIDTTRCAAERRRPLSIANPLSVRLGRACPACPNNDDLTETGAGLGKTHARNKERRS